MKKRQKFYITRRGFSLIELLIVIAIIGILSTLAMVNFMSVKQRARDAQRKSDLLQIQSGVELYKADQSAYPLSNQVVCGVSLAQGTVTYIKKISCDPLGASYYNGGAYYYNSNGTTYTLGACIENGNDTNPNVTGTNPGGTGTCSSGKYYVVTAP